MPLPSLVLHEYCRSPDPLLILRQTCRQSQHYAHLAHQPCHPHPVPRHTKHASPALTAAVLGLVTI